MVEQTVSVSIPIEQEISRNLRGQLFLVSRIYKYVAIHTLSNHLTPFFSLSLFFRFSRTLSLSLSALGNSRPFARPLARPPARRGAFVAAWFVNRTGPDERV